MNIITKRLKRIAEEYDTECVFVYTANVRTIRDSYEVDVMGSKNEELTSEAQKYLPMRIERKLLHKCIQHILNSCKKELEGLMSECGGELISAKTFDEVDIELKFALDGTEIHTQYLKQAITNILNNILIDLDGEVVDYYSRKMEKQDISSASIYSEFELYDAGFLLFTD